MRTSAREATPLIMGFLLPNVLGYRGLVQSHRRNVAAFGPKMPVAELVLQVGVQGACH